ncbi:TPA: BppU family phage baseplate upper protein [Enterococcus faecium]|nr:BppU family phage baseplate upper protein [Enterococcus faecium]HAQ6684034.1 BppU family phage baseplate upper protein [Enterococcus faecium]HAQ6692836.1 BppU family phage baseplate upper protein [Enterococcus faecium]HAQ7624183.1 BppU family phage baseplate upper protein [Enterococcus faecium]HAQ7647587.1 BppU family phage baseplate upper protein [Enterococcus faecium]
MAHVIKKGSIKVPTQPKDYDLQATGLVFKSYDNQIALEFNVEQQNGTPADLLGANLRLLMFIYDEVDGMITKEPIPFITKNLITESFLNGHVKYILPEALKAYNGVVETYVYIEYPDGTTSDNIGFTFRMKRSEIDGLAQDKADYFIEDFQQLIDGVKQEATDAVNEALAKVEVVSKNVSSAQNDLTILEDRIDQTNQQIGDLGKLKKMYSNSIDFGDYDYSGNPNLMANINADSFSQGTGALSVVDDGDEVVITLDPNHKLEVLKPKSQPALLTGKTYTVSVEIMLEGDFTGDPSKIGLRYIKMPNWVSELYTRNTLTATKGVWQKLTGTVKITAASDNAESWLIMLQNKDANNSLSGKLRLRHAKLEEGSTATPYQPNLLDAPYYLSKVALGENLIKPESQQPVTNSNYLINTYNIKPMVKGKKYTITLEGTKPATQVFRPFFTRATGDAWEVGDLQPVEGLTNVWSKTFTAADDSHPTTPQVQIYQVPSTSVGQCTIKWLKLEEGNTRTPNISQFKYFGEGLKDSNNPNDYSWDVTPEYTEKGLNNAVNVYDPQRVEGLKNFADGIQIAGDKVISENDCTVYTLTKDNSQSFIDGYATFIKHGKEVIVNGTVKFKKAYAFGVPLDDEVPDEFVAKIVHGMLTGPSGTSSVSKAMYVRKDLGTIITNSEFAANEWFTFHGNYWVGEE